MSITPYIYMFFLAFIGLFISEKSVAAYCSLRDPVLAISALYQNATDHRSIVKMVGQDTRNEIAKSLPFSLHFNEIGKHTLYVAMNEDKALGFVHSRSELSDWGLIEVAWGISPEMTLDGFYLQRCRDPICSNSTFVKNISALIKDKNFNQILALLNESKTDLSNSVKADFSNNASLLLAILKSALKTIKVTEYNWADDINEIKRKQIVSQVFEGYENIHFKPVNPSEKKMNTQTMVITESVKAFNVYSNNSELGYLVQADWQQADDKGRFIWLFSPQGDVLHIHSTSDLPKKEIAIDFANMRGKNVANQHQCSTATDLAGNTLFSLSSTD